MNTRISDAAVETAIDAYENAPGVMQFPAMKAALEAYEAHKAEQQGADARAQFEASSHWPEVDRVLTDAYVAGSDREDFDLIEARRAIHAALATVQPTDFDDRELQFYREHVVNDLDNMLIDAGVFEVTHEGGYEACWANSMDALERLIDRQPVGQEPVVAWLIERLRGKGYGRDNYVVMKGQASSDPDSHLFWTDQQARDNHRVTPLYAAPPAQAVIKVTSRKAALEILANLYDQEGRIKDARDIRADNLDNEEDIAVSAIMQASQAVDLGHFRALASEMDRFRTKWKTVSITEFNHYTDRLLGLIDSQEAK